MSSSTSFHVLQAMDRGRVPRKVTMSFNIDTPTSLCKSSSNSLLLTSQSVSRLSNTRMEGSLKKRTTAFSGLPSEMLISRLVAMMLISFALEFGDPADLEAENDASQRTKNLDAL